MIENAKHSRRSVVRQLIKLSEDTLSVARLANQTRVTTQIVKSSAYGCRAHESRAAEKPVWFPRSLTLERAIDEKSVTHQSKNLFIRNLSELTQACHG